MQPKKPLKANGMPTILIIFGATGDLFARKIVPALFHLFETQELPKLFQVIGVARKPLSREDFQAKVAGVIKDHNLTDDEDALLKFLHLFTYEQGEFTHAEDYTRIAKTLGLIDGEWRACSNKLFYLAVPPAHYGEIFEHLASSGLTEPCSPEEGWTRVIVEKPFGKDLETAKELDVMLGKLFKEEQIFRIDHYLAKEMLQNILAFRFSNNLFETSWGNRLIERIEIRLLENIGVEDRGTFYDGIGALRDIGQNHLLQILAMLTMERPLLFSAEAVRAKRSAILQALPILSEEQARVRTDRAQYAGYQDVTGVVAESPTETYFRIETELSHPNWKGVPILLEGGKRTGDQRKEVQVIFRHTMPCFCPGPEHAKNGVNFILEPDERITIEFWSKKPGQNFAIEKRSFDFLYRDKKTTREETTDYAKLLYDCFVGDQLLFVSTEEITAMWRFIDPIVKAWQKNIIPLRTYPADTHPGIDRQSHDTNIPSPTKQIGMVGLGKMGKGLALQLLEKDWQIVGYNRSRQITDQLAPLGLTPSYSLKELVSSLSQPRVLWLMLPSVLKEGASPIDQTLEELILLLDPGDIIIEGGNSFFEDTKRRAEQLKRAGITLLDVGVSGGPAGARLGACLMIGGESETFARLEPLFAAVSVPGGYRFFPGAGAGHFAKMIHNGIEYGMMQAIAEGFDVLRHASYEYDLTQVAEIYNNGSVIESRLIHWLRQGLAAHGADLSDVTSTVAHTGEGAWTVETAKKIGVPTPIIEGALEFRKLSAANPSYTGKILSALREQFGGHNSK